jgi:HK97 family phage portal protein
MGVHRQPIPRVVDRAVIVHSAGALAVVTPPPLDGRSVAPTTAGGSLYSMSAATYALIYRTQPNVRKVIDFVARNVAQIGIHAFRRVSDLDRQRLADHDVIRWLDRPNPATTQYRLFDALMKDLGIYFNAYWLKTRRPDGSIGLTRLPPEDIAVDGWLVPGAFLWTLPDGRIVTLAPSEVVHFPGYDPHNPLTGLSPLETLRRVLAEDAAQTAYRAEYWHNASRIEGVIERPAGAPRWTTDQKQAFREQWQSRYGAGAGAGQTAVLEDGMTFKATSFSARDSEFIPSRKLTAEEVASAYHVPLPMVGILEHATFSNIREQHKQLYQDCLGPHLEMVAAELMRQLLPESRDTENVYLEFNIAEKLKGSFEEQANSLYYLVGRPIMTLNEGRSRLNLPRITDDPSADAVALPLNTEAGGTPEPPDLPAAADAPAAGPVLVPARVADHTSARLAALATLIDAELEHVA